MFAVISFAYLIPLSLLFMNMNILNFNRFTEIVLHRIRSQTM